jgi:radical SAM protein with 4Fe4S-binding SPASM domain
VIPASRVNLEDPRFRKPYTVCFMPTLFCPQRCVYCQAKLAPQPEEERISLKRLQVLFAEMRGIGVEVVRMTGGDPFARKDIFDVLEAVFEEGMVPDVPTKLGLTWYEVLRLKDLGVKLVQVGLDTVDPTILDRMAGVKGYHHRIFRLFDNLRRAGLGARVSTVLTPMNVATVGRLIDYLGGLGNVESLTLAPYARSLFSHRDELFLGRADYELVEQQVKERETLYPQMRIAFGGVPAPAAPAAGEKERRWRERPLCTANRHGFVILPDGRVTVCEELYDHPAFLIGDLRQQSVMEMWTSPRALALLQPERSEVPGGACGTCGAFAECNLAPGRCWRDVVKAYGWNRQYYPDPRCPLAPTGNRLN